MTRFLLPAGLLLLAACSGGKDDKSGPEDSAAISPLQKADPVTPSAPPEKAEANNADRADGPAESESEAEAESEAGPGNGDKTIPAAIQGRWALKAADCKAKRGLDLTALTIDATNLRFYESHGELARVREKATDRIDADYKFSGEGMDWDRRMSLGIEDGGKTLVRRDYGEGAAAEPMRYTRCA